MSADHTGYSTSDHRLTFQVLNDSCGFQIFSCNRRLEGITWTIEKEMQTSYIAGNKLKSSKVFSASQKCLLEVVSQARHAFFCLSDLVATSTYHLPLATLTTTAKNCLNHGISLSNFSFLGKQGKNFQGESTVRS